MRFTFPWKTTLIFTSGFLLTKYLTRKRNKSVLSAENATPLQNWAGNLTYSTNQVFYPKSLEEVQVVVKSCRKLRALGSKHSFNRVADSVENLVSLQEMAAVVSLNKEEHTVTVEGGMRYGELAPYLQQNGYALPNLASLPHITVVGACATGTHGSGTHIGNLSTAVTALELVNAAGEVVTYSAQKDPEKLQGAVVGLGALGVVTKITLRVQPAFAMRQVVYQNLPMQVLEERFEEIMASGYSVSLFTDWQNQSINEVWIKSIVEEDQPFSPAPTFFGASLAKQNLHPIESESAVNTTDQMGVPGYWYDRLPHFKMGFKPSAGAELQSEYFVPLPQAYQAFKALEKLAPVIGPHLFISEIRTVQADTLWLSPCYNQTCVAFHTTWKQDVDKVNRLLPLIEAQLAPFMAKPHWGKLFTMPPEVLQTRYERLPDFKALVKEQDPHGKFRNEFLEYYLYS